MAELNNSNMKRPVFPIGLLSSGRKCLVVGGGKIGLRKVRLLLEADAEVYVTSPELHPELQELVENDRITHSARPFQQDDVDGFFLVFAATSDRSVNLDILETCRRKGVYACSVDKTWPTGDFVTPATVRKDGITIAVSTGGKSCRRSKMIKASFQRHLEMVKNADLIVVGTSHNFLSIQEREPFHVTGARLEQIGQMLMQIWGVHEFAILNTCNRIELHAAASGTPGVEQVIQHIMSFDHLGPDRFYVKRGSKAFEHTSLLTAGLLSQTPGEKHIVAQLKDALSVAVDKGWAGPMLQQWYSSALHVSKDIRRETEGVLQDHEIEDLCLLYLDREQPGWRGGRAMVVGTGVIGSSICSQLVKAGVEVDWCYHRNRPAVEASRTHLIRQHSMSQISDLLPRAAVVICATGGQGHLIHPGHAPLFDPQKKPLIVDLAIPRNVDPQLDQAGNGVRVVDLDTLKHWYRREKADMTGIFETSNRIVDDHRDMYDKLINSFQGGNAPQ